MVVGVQMWPTVHIPARSNTDKIVTKLDLCFNVNDVWSLMVLGPSHFHHPLPDRLISSFAYSTKLRWSDRVSFDIGNEQRMATCSPRRKPDIYWQTEGWEWPITWRISPSLGSKTLFIVGNFNAFRDLSISRRYDLPTEWGHPNYAYPHKWKCAAIAEAQNKITHDFISKTASVIQQHQ